MTCRNQKWSFAATAMLGLALASCSAPRERGPERGGDAGFEQLAEEVLTAYLAWRPQTGVALGLHEHDGKITDMSRGSIEAERRRLRDFEQRLVAMADAAQRPPDALALSHGASIDLRVLLTALRSELFRIEVQEVYTRNPMTYAGALDVNIYIKRNFAPLSDRLRSIIAILELAPAIFAAARVNLAATLPRPFVETAIEIANGAAEFLSKDLVAALAAVTDARLLGEFRLAKDRAVAELRGYAEWLAKEKLPTASQDFALGRENFARMLREQELIDVPPDRLLELGLVELHKQQQILADAARVVDPKQPPLAVFKATQRDHPAADDLIPYVRRSLEAIRQFLLDLKIVSMPSAVRAQVDATPQYLRATSFASMDTPGPFESRATEAYYYVTPVEPHWPPAQQEEWLTAFNYYATDVISIHEAYPGHYTQFLCLNASSVSRVRKVFTSYAFVEGWAHYAEQMMIEEGFGRDLSVPLGTDVRAAKYRLGQSVEALLRWCRWCVAIKLHCDGMSVDEATRFFQENCYYEEKPSRQEAVRGTFDPGYLFYSVGKLQFLKLREDYRQEQGDKYSLGQFHDEVLRHGAPPIRLLRELLLVESRWAERW